jgi:hypothetical protein
MKGVIIITWRSGTLEFDPAEMAKDFPHDF